MQNIQFTTSFMIVMLLVFTTGTTFAQNTYSEETSQLPEFTDNVVKSKTIVQDRTWATNQIQKTQHENFLSYVNAKLDDNQWNKDMQRENINNYNLETRIGVDVDGYELSTLFAQLEKINGAYKPTKELKKLHEWTFIKYDIPDHKNAVLERISKITNNQDIEIVKQLVNSTNTMTNYGNVEVEIHQIDPEFWSLVGNTKLCELEKDCDLATLNKIAGQSADITPVTTYKKHTSTIYIIYKPCETSTKTCTEFVYNIGTGPKTVDIAGPNHVQDKTIYVSMTGWTSSPDHIIVVAKITGPVKGGSVTGVDDDGYVTKTGYLINPNARAESRAEIGFISYAYSQ